jgi:hypothetical protein
MSHSTRTRRRVRTTALPSLRLTHRAKSEFLVSRIVVMMPPNGEVEGPGTHA